MEQLTKIEKFIDWIYDTFIFNCKKGRHEWGYKLSDTGVVYLDESKVPDSAWQCSRCGKRKYEELTTTNTR